MNFSLPLSDKQEVEKHLLWKKKQIEEQLKSLESSDPVMLNDAPESSELGTEAWQADVHAKTEVVKNSLEQLYHKIKQSLDRLKDGTYGRCDHCRKQIENERLKVIPTATLCVACVAIG